MAAATERIRSAARNLAGTARSLQSDIYSHCLLFKQVAEDLERQHNSDEVEKVRQGFLETLQSAHGLEHHCLSLDHLSDNFQAASEATDFEKVLHERSTASERSKPFDPRKESCYEQFNQCIWNVHHEGEVAPGREHDEMVMLSSQFGVKNSKCPLTGKSVTELREPVCNKECEHIYERETVLGYIQRQKNGNARKRSTVLALGVLKSL